MIIYTQKNDRGILYETFNYNSAHKVISIRNQKNFNESEEDFKFAEEELKKLEKRFKLWN